MVVTRRTKEGSRVGQEDARGEGPEAEAEAEARGSLTPTAGGVSTAQLLAMTVCIAVIFSFCFSIGAIFDLGNQQRDAFIDFIADHAVAEGTPAFYQRAFRRQQRQQRETLGRAEESGYGKRGRATEAENSAEQAPPIDVALVRHMCYMDEIFHVPAAWRYGVDGNFTYLDPMITTPPGAYVPAAAALNAWATAKVLTESTCDAASAAPAFAASRPTVKEMPLPRGAAPCDPGGVVMAPTRALMLFGEGVSLARATNVVLHAATLVVTFSIAARLHPPALLGNLLLSSAIVGIPSLMFLTTLMYTDVLSALVVVALLRCAPPRCGAGGRLFSLEAFSEWAAVALLGLMGVLVRQTNIVWLFFVAARHVLGEALLAATPAAATVAATKTRAPRLASAFLSCAAWCAQLVAVVAVGALFAAFVLVVNEGSVVLGDAASHRPAAHWAQLAHCFVFAAFTAPASSAAHGLLWLFEGRGASSGAFLLKIALLLLTLICFGFALDRGVVAHPYILADNRHFTFYYHRRFLLNRAARLVVLPAVAVLGVTPLLRMLCHVPETDTRRETRGRAHVVLDGVLLLLCAAATTVPQQLLEFRYFAPPLIVYFVLLHDHLGAPPLTFADDRRRGHGGAVNVRWGLWLLRVAGTLDVVWRLTIHAVTLALFLWAPFTAPDGSVGRFMW